MVRAGVASRSHTRHRGALHPRSGVSRRGFPRAFAAPARSRYVVDRGGLGAQPRLPGKLSGVLDPRSGVSTGGSRTHTVGSRQAASWASNPGSIPLLWDAGPPPLPPPSTGLPPCYRRFLVGYGWQDKALPGPLRWWDSPRGRTGSVQDNPARGTWRGGLLALLGRLPTWWFSGASRAQWSINRSKRCLLGSLPACGAG